MNTLLTGASGFLGSIIYNRLNTEKIQVKSVGRSISDDYYFDFKSARSLSFDHSFDVVIHCAGKAHITPENSEDAADFYKINVEGTKNFLDALQQNDALPKSFVFISTIAVYGRDTGHLLSEDTPLNATDPYGKSKINAEVLINDWCDRNGVICTILRLPLVAGPNPPGNLQAMIKGIKKGYYFNIANGAARKSVVMADDVAKIIPKASLIGGIYNLTDRCHPTFFALAQLIANQLNKSTPKNMPSWAAYLLGRLGDILGKKAPINSSKLKKMALELTFDDSKANVILGWRPSKVLSAFKIS